LANLLLLCKVRGRKVVRSLNDPTQWSHLGIVL
jgi:hypothetical protein